MERRDFLRTASIGAVAAGAWWLTGCATGASGSAPAGGPQQAAGAPAGAGAQPGGGRGSKLQEVLKRGKVIVGTGSTNPPWHFEDDKGNLIGFDIELAQLLAKGLFKDPTKVEFVRQKPDARIPNLQSGQVDVIFQFMTVNADRAQLAEFTIPYYREGVNLLVKANSPYTGATSMAGKKSKISVLQNNYADDMVHAGVPDAQVLQFDTEANAILALDSGRADAAAIDDSTCRWLFAQSPGKYKVGDSAWYPQTYAAAVLPGDTSWLRYVNTVLHEAMTGVEWQTYKTAFKKYFGADLKDPATGFPMEFGGLRG